MEISVVIPSKNGLHHLKDCLPSVIKAAQKRGGNIRIIVADDHSSDGTLQEAPRLFPEVTFIANSSQGACSARNSGVNKFSCDWICFLDNDVFVDEDFFITAEKYLRPDVFCVTCAGYSAYPKTAGEWEQLDGLKLLEYKSGFLRFTKNLYNRVLPALDEYPSWGVQGAYFFCNRKQFDDLGGFDEILAPYLLEETDLAYRGLKRGWKILYAPDTRLKHKCGGTINSKKSKRTQFLSKRNRILFMWKNVQSVQMRAMCWVRFLLSFSPRLWWECLRLQGKIREKAREEARAARVSDNALLTQSSAFFAHYLSGSVLRRALNVSCQLTYLQERLFRYGDKYHSVWQIAFHMLWACLISLRFNRRSKNSLSGPVRICIQFEGGMGDLLIGLNWLCAFYEQLGRMAEVRIDAAFPNKKLLESFAPDFVRRKLTRREWERYSYDLVLSLMRCPVVVSADEKRLPPDLLAYVEKLLRFERDNKELLLLTPYKDSLTHNVFSSCSKRWHQPDIVDEFNLREEFVFTPQVKDEAAVLRKFNLLGKKYITVNREVGHERLAESTKLWPLVYYRKLVEKLKKCYPNYEILEVGSGKGERIGNMHRNLAGKTSLEEIKAVLKNAVLHIDCEGGLVHLRHALKGGPSCVFFGPTSPVVYGYGENLNLRSSACSVCCEFYSKTWQQACIKGKHVCMESLSPEYVLEQIERSRLLAGKENTK